MTDEEWFTTDEYVYFSVEIGMIPGRYWYDTFSIHGWYSGRYPEKSTSGGCASGAKGPHLPL